MWKPLPVAPGEGERRAGCRPGKTAAQGHAFLCRDATLRGSYGVQMQGTRPVPPPTDGFESVIGVVIRTYDGGFRVKCAMSSD